MNNKINIREDIECRSCKGTGLYKGMAEKEGSAVVCYICQGSGKETLDITYTKFTKRKERFGVTRVYQSGLGYVITDTNITLSNGKVIPFSEYGVPYEDWLKGSLPKPMKCYECPLQFYTQGTKVGEWLKSEGVCSKYLPLGGNITICSIERRETCWEWTEESKEFQEMLKGQEEEKL